MSLVRKPLWTNKPVDTHVHLEQIPYMEGVLERARQAGLGAVVAVGTNLDSNRAVMLLSENIPDRIWPALGAHPWHLAPAVWPDALAFIERNLPRAVALGEVGLDYRYGIEDHDFQRRALAALLELAARFDKPVSFHAIAAHDDSLNMLEAAGIRRAVFHWFSGPAVILDRILEAGYWVSATPALAYSKPHRAALASAPLDRILVETDSPQDYQGRASEPADLWTTIRLLAELKDLTPDETAEATTRNARRFFFEED